MPLCMSVLSDFCVILCIVSQTDYLIPFMPFNIVRVISLCKNLSAFKFFILYTVFNVL